jgi:hypothetical protein
MQQKNEFIDEHDEDEDHEVGKDVKTGSTS